MRNAIQRITTCILAIAVFQAMCRPAVGATAASGHAGVSTLHVLWHEVADVSGCSSPARANCSGCEAPGHAGRKLLAGWNMVPAATADTASARELFAASGEGVVCGCADWVRPQAHLHWLGTVVIRS